jgi:TRAP-type mannitol/chloroaromatic compound transport system permease small subunit
MGTLSAAIAMLAAAALVVLPAGSVLVFLAVAMMLAGLGLAVRFERRPGFMSAATMAAVLATLVIDPFGRTRQQLGSLVRAAAQGDAAAAASIEFHAALEPYRAALLLAVVVAILALYCLAARRSAGGGHAFLLAESDALAALAARVGVLASFLYAPMIAIIVYDVGQRKYLDLDPGFTSTTWYRLFTSTKLQELEWHLHAVLFLMCLAFAYVRDAHVRIDLVRAGLRPRTRAWIELLGCVLFLLPYCYVVVSHGHDFVRNSFAILERSAAQTGLGYRFIIKSFLPFGFLLLGLAGVSVALRCIVHLSGLPVSGPHVVPDPTERTPLAGPRESRR